MAFEQRGSGRYFYLATRDPATGKVKKQYLGRGPQAEAAVSELVRRRELREDERRAVREAADAMTVADALAAELEAAVTLMTEAFLLAAGYRRHNYGAWRRRHGHGRTG